MDPWDQFPDATPAAAADPWAAFPDATPDAAPVDSYAPPATVPTANPMDSYAPPTVAAPTFTTPAEKQLTGAEFIQMASQAGLRGAADLAGSVYDLPNAAFMGTQWLMNEADQLATGAQDVPSVGLGEALGGLFGGDTSGPPANLGDAIAETASTLDSYIPAIPNHERVPPMTREDMGNAEFLYDPIRFGVGAGLAGTGLSQLAKTAKLRLDTTGQRAAGDSFLLPYMDRPVAAITRDVGSGVGAATGQDVASDYTDNPFLQTLAAVAGGIGGHTAPAGVQNARGGAINAAEKTRSADQIVPVDPDTRMPFRQGEVNLAAQELQRRTGDRRSAAMDALDRNRAELEAAGVPPEAMPTFGLLTEDPGLIQQERGFRTSQPDEFIQRDQGIKDYAAEQVQGLRDPTADLGAVGRRAEGARLERMAPLTQEVDARQAVVNDVASGIASEGASYEPFRSRPEHYRTQASRNLDTAIVDEGYIPAREQKNALYDQIDPNRSEFVSIEPIRGTLQQIRNQITEFGPEALQMPTDFVTRIQRILDRAGPDEDMTASVGELAQLRPFIARARANALKSGNLDVRDNLNAIQQAIDGIIGDHPAAAAANRNYTDNYAPTYRPGPGDEAAKFTQQIDREPFGEGGVPTRTQTPPERTADRFLSAPEKAAAVDRMIQAAANPEAGRRAVRDYFMSDFAASAFNNDGSVNPQRANAWLQNNEPTLSQFPMLLRDFEQRVARSGAMRREAQAADTELTAAQQRLRQGEQDVQRGAIGTLLNDDPRNVAKRLLAKGNYGAEAELDDINRVIGDDATARQGWQEAVREVINDKITSAVPAGDEGYEVALAALSREFKENEALLARVFPDTEDMNVLQQVNSLLGYFRGLGKKATPGSDTASLLREADLGDSLFGKAGQLVIRHIYGDLKGGGIVRRYKLMASLLPTSRTGAQKIAYMTQFNPELGRYLLGLPVRNVKAIPNNFGLRAAVAADIANEGDNAPEEE